MFVLFATKSLNDGTNGFRFNFAGIKGLTRKRVSIKRWGISSGACMTAYHLGKRSVYVETKANKPSGRRIRHFAG